MEQQGLGVCGAEASLVHRSPSVVSPRVLHLTFLTLLSLPLLVP